MRNLLITICARGGSKGIPLKNIRHLGGKPLIEYTYNHAVEFGAWAEKEFGCSVKIELSTDSSKIIEVCKNINFNTNYIRPDYLANDTAGKLDAIKDVILFSEKENNVKFDFVLDLDVSAPMRTVAALQESINTLVNNAKAINLFSVSEAHKNPYFNMVEQNMEGFYDLSKKGDTVLSRQTAPSVYEMNASFYFYRREFYENENLYLFQNSLIYKMTHESFDLDTILDFEFLDFLVTNNKLSFKL